MLDKNNLKFCIEIVFENNLFSNLGQEKSIMYYGSEGVLYQFCL